MPVSISNIRVPRYLGTCITLTVDSSTGISYIQNQIQYIKLEYDSDTRFSVQCLKTVFKVAKIEHTDAHAIGPKNLNPKFLQLSMQFPVNSGPAHRKGFHYHNILVLNAESDSVKNAYRWQRPKGS